MEDDVQLLHAIARRAARQLRAPIAIAAWMRDGLVVCWAIEGSHPPEAALVTALAAQAPRVYRGAEGDAMGDAASRLGLRSFASARSTSGSDVAVVFVGDMRTRDFEPAALAALDELATEAVTGAQDLKRT